MARGVGKAREYDYSNVGTAGRRTGLTLKEGRRDEHGMEEVDGLFSSPEKSPAKLNGFDEDEEEEEEEGEEDENEGSIGSDMSIDEDNAPGPMDFLNARSQRQQPAPSQSPVKNSARTRRSPVIQSSPEPEQDFSSPSDGKSMLASNNGNVPSPLSTRSVNAGPKNNKSNSMKAKPAPEPIVNDFSDDEQDENVSFAVDDENGFDEGNDTVMQDDIPEPIEQDLDQSDSDAGEDVPPVPSRETVKTAKPKPTQKAPAKNTTAGKGKAAGRPGRPAKAARSIEEDTSEARPAKKQKVAKESRPQEPLDPELDRVVENYSQRSGPLKGRSLYILKRENPSDEVSTHTRSGRVSVRPLAYWRNERCVYGDGEAAEGQRYPLSTIKEIIRTEELEPEKKGKGKRGKKSKSGGKSKRQREESSDEEDENMDEWEKSGGILHGIVPQWDPETGGTGEEITDIVAYAPSGIQTKEVKGSTFKFAKLLSSSFIGSGVVELPPEGVKKPKNSKKMHMVFYVCNGRVQVDISGVHFSAGKGCVFQVPRGNHYSFANPYDKDAKLFFTQGCVPDGTEEYAAATPARNSQFDTDTAQGPSESESQSNSKSNAKPKSKPGPKAGRKGKQKAK